MYRLYNFGIKSKIDWIVKNGKVKGRKIIVSPWNEETIDMCHYLIEKWGINKNDIIIVDDEVNKYNEEILNIQQLNAIRLDYRYIALVISYNNFIVRTLTNGGVPYENIYVVKGNELRAQDALIKCGEDAAITTVLDVGCGIGNHSGIFLEYGKTVTGIDIGVPCNVQSDRFTYIRDNFLEYNFAECYDLVWCSHVLEHQLAVGKFIQKLFSCCKENGKVAITVPNETQGRVVEGHVNVWNAGLLMYNIIKSGFSCRHAAVKTYANNVSVIVPYEKIETNEHKIRHSRQYFPSNMVCGQNEYGGVAFDGNIMELNWD